MRILFVSNLYPPYVIGGAEKYVFEVSNKLSKRDEVHVLTTRSFSFDSVFLKKEGNIYSFYPLNLYHTYDARFKPEVIKPIWHMIDLWNPHSFLVLRKLLKILDPDVVFTHNVGNLSTSIFKAIKESGTPHVHMLHDYSLLCPRATLCNSRGEICVRPRKSCIIYRQTKRALVGNPDAVVAPSKFVLGVHLKERFFEESRAFRLSLPVRKVERVEKDYGELRVLYVGQIVRHKGLDVLLEAVRGVHGVVVDVVGSGKLGDEKNVIYHGHVEENRLRHFYMGANVVVVPSIWLENSPKVIYESFGYSTPVVASRIGGIPEIVSDFCNGLLFTPNDSKELREKLVMLSEDASLLRKLERGAAKTGERLTMGRHIKKLRKILKSVT